MDIHYSIKFHTDWHCGSGLAAGADVDALVVKDENGLPYIPGKTIKGLVREAMSDIIGFRQGCAPSSNNEIQVDDSSDFITAFGYSGKLEYEEPKDEKEDYKLIKHGAAFFTNAELNEDEKSAIVKQGLARFMYRSIASTAINENGIAVEHSLRKMEVTVPCTLEGNILNVPESLADDIIDALKYIKRLGQNRNRGLGRCSITAEKGGTK